MIGHTKGPLELGRMSRCAPFEIRDPKGRTIAQTRCPDGMVPEEERANAELFVLAPGMSARIARLERLNAAMLEALEGLRDQAAPFAEQLRKYGPAFGFNREGPLLAAIRQADATLSQARGEGGE